MLFDNPDPGLVSMRRPQAGTYPAVLIGVCYLGLHAGDFGDRPQLMFRWEIHDDEGNPCLDDKGKVYAATQTYNATIKDNLEGQPSTLAKVLNAHGISTAVGSRIDSWTWVGKTATVTIERSGNQGEYANVVEVEPIDPDIKIAPFAVLEHWEPEPGQQARAKNPPPTWAEWKIGRSTNISHLAADQFRRTTRSTGVDRNGPSSTPQGRQPAGGYRPAPSDEEDIPFRYPYMNTHHYEDSEGHQSWVARSAVSNVTK